MIIPYRADVPYDRRPFGNWLIVLGCVLVFGCQLAAVLRYLHEHPELRIPGADVPDRHQPVQPDDGTADLHDRQGGHIETGNNGGALAAFEKYILRGWSLTGLAGYMWIHGSLWHLIGNLIFLWVFGNAVCAKLGNLRYLGLYLLCGILAGLVHLMFSGGAVVGASGAINGVVGMFLVFFPENEVSCYWMLFFPFGKRFSVSSIWIILMWFVFDVLGAIFFSGTGVAYYAHVGGFVTGAAVAVLLLKTKWVVMEEYEKSLLQWLGLDQSGQRSSVRPDLYYWQQDGLERQATAETIPADASASRPARQAEISQSLTFQVHRAAAAAAPAPARKKLIRFTCSCGKVIKATAGLAGRRGRCPACGTVVTVPKPRPVGTSAPGRDVAKMIRFSCPCGKVIKAPAKYAGRKGRCPRCQRVLQVPLK